MTNDNLLLELAIADYDPREIEQRPKARELVSKLTKVKWYSSIDDDDGAWVLRTEDNSKTLRITFEQHYFYEPNPRSVAWRQKYPKAR